MGVKPLFLLHSNHHLYIHLATFFSNHHFYVHLVTFILISTFVKQIFPPQRPISYPFQQQTPYPTVTMQLSSVLLVALTACTVYAQSEVISQPNAKS